MKSAYLKAVFFVCALGAFVSGALTASAQTEVLPYTQTWKYLVRTNDITNAVGGSLWNTTGFNDAAWPTGTGIFRYAAGEALPAGFSGGTTLPFSNNCAFEGRYIQTVYFRSTFTYSNPTNFTTVTISNIVDDGLVIYLNGVEVNRGTNMPAGAVNWTTGAPASVEALAQGELGVTFSPTNLIQGVNTVAVEVHNNGTASSDMVFGLRVLIGSLTPVAITNNPQNRTIEAGSTTNMTVGASGSSPAYRWQRESTPGSFTNIPNQTGVTLTFASVLPSQTGKYRAVVTNVINNVTSTVAQLTVFVNQLIITNEPEDLDLEVSEPLDLTVGVSGSAPGYQWQKDNGAGGTFLNIAGARSATYAVGSAQLVNAGKYRCVITNFSGAVTSRVAIVKVAPDLTGPRMISAQISETLTNTIEILFSEALLRSTVTNVNTTNFVISILNTTNQTVTTNRLVISNITHTVREARITVASLPIGPTYVVTCNNVADTKSNSIAPNSQIAVVYRVTLTNIIAAGDTWRTYDYGDNVQGTNWNRFNYDPEPTFWGAYPGAFYRDFDNLTLCPGFAKTTSLSLNVANYFRTTFVLTNFATNATLFLDYAIDDGAVFYLNETEIHRFNMIPGTPVNDSTLASGAVGNAVCNEVNIPVNNLISGTNLLAVEVHQGGAFPYENDFAFGMSLGGTFLTRPTLPAQTNVPNVTLTRQGNNARLSWSGYGWALETTANISGLWTEAQPFMSNPHTNIIGSGARFYRLRKAY